MDHGNATFPSFIYNPCIFSMLNMVCNKMGRKEPFLFKKNAFLFRQSSPHFVTQARGNELQVCLGSPNLRFLFVLFCFVVIVVIPEGLVNQVRLLLPKAVNVPIELFFSFFFLQVSEAELFSLTKSDERDAS